MQIEDAHLRQTRDRRPPTPLGTPTPVRSTPNATPPALKHLT